MTTSVDTPQKTTFRTESEWRELGRKVVFRYGSKTSHGVRRYMEECTVAVGVESVAELFPRVLAFPPSAPLKGKGHDRESLDGVGFSKAVAEFVPEAHKTTVSMFGGPGKTGKAMLFFSREAANLVLAWDRTDRPLEAAVFLSKLRFFLLLARTE